MDNNIEQQILNIFEKSISTNVDEINWSSEKIKALYSENEKENYIKILWKFIIYPYEEKKEKKYIYDRYLNKNFKISILISIKNFIKKSVYSDLENIKLSNEICMYIKNICLLCLLESYNEDIKSLEKYFFEILYNLFKFNICDEYDYLIFYILLLYISDYDVNNLISLCNTEDKKKNSFVLKNLQCVILFVQCQKIFNNMNQENFQAQYNELIKNIDNIIDILKKREGSLTDDITEYINNTTRVYKYNGKYNMFLLNDLVLFNIIQNDKNITSFQPSYINEELIKESSSNIFDNFDFVGKGVLLNDYNGNLRILNLSKHKNLLRNVKMNIFKKKFLSLKIIRKIIKHYSDATYNSKYDLKIILTHIEYHLSLYFIYLYNKFKDFNEYILDMSRTINLNDKINDEVNNAFYLMNDILLNKYIFLKIYYNIHMIDLPEYYEDNIDIFFNIFFNILLYNNQGLKSYYMHINILNNMKEKIALENQNIHKSSLFLNHNMTINELKNNTATAILNKIENLMKVKESFEKNIIKCKIIITDIIRIYAERYQEESKMYIMKIIYALANITYDETDKNLLCHVYNCLSSTIKLIHHMSLETNALNPYKDVNFLKKLIETALIHMKLKKTDIEEILDGDLDYFKSDINNDNSYSLRSTSIHFLKTICNTYDDISLPILEMRILSENSLEISNDYYENIKNRNEENEYVEKNNIMYEVCNIEYKIQLVNCLKKSVLIQNIYDHYIKNMLKEFVVSFHRKYEDIEDRCYDINSYNFSNPYVMNSSANNIMNKGNKTVWLNDNEFFTNVNTILLMTYLKFFLNNKQICTEANVMDLFTFFYFLLFNEKIMIHNYSSLCINRYLNEKSISYFIHLVSSLVTKNILNRLLFLLRFQTSIKILNEYTLITIFRIFVLFPNQLTHYYVPVILLVDEIIKSIINDTFNPIFNHYLFELLILVVSLIYKTQMQDNIKHVENVIIYTFSQILQLYIHDFIPYIFQILSIIIDNTNQVQDIHIKILNNLYDINFWKSSIGNANGIMCVLKSYFKKYNLFEDIIKANMQELFNIYHYCLSNKKLTTDSFQIILIVFTYLPIESYLQFVKPLLILLFTLLQQYKNDIIKIKVIHSLSIFILKTNVDIFVNTVEEIQNGLILNVLKNLYMPILDKLINVNEKIVVFIALSKILNQEKVRNTPNIIDFLDCVNKNITSNELILNKNDKKKKNVDIEKDEMDHTFEVTYVKLQMLNNENVNEMALQNMNVNEELKINLLNSHFIPILQQNNFQNILQLIN